MASMRKSLQVLLFFIKASSSTIWNRDHGCQLYLLNKLMLQVKLCFYMHSSNLVPLNRRKHEAVQSPDFTHQTNLGTIYLYIYIYIYIHTHIYIDIICVCIYIDIICVCIYIIYIYIHTHAYIIYMRVCIYIYIYIYIE